LLALIAAVLSRTAHDPPGAVDTAGGPHTVLPLATPFPDGEGVDGALLVEGSRANGSLPFVVLTASGKDHEEGEGHLVDKRHGSLLDSWNAKIESTGVDH